MTSSQESKPARQSKTNENISNQLNNIFKKLSELELESICSHGARLWIDSFDQEIHITFYSGDEHSSRRIMEAIPCLGHWVSIEISPLTSEDRPVDADGNLQEGWSGASAYAVDQLLQHLHEIASDLELKVESVIEQLNLQHPDVQRINNALRQPHMPTTT